MQREHIVELVGGGDEATALLRLQLRRAAKQLRAPWRLRRDNDATIDMMIVADTGEIPGEELKRCRLIDPSSGPTAMSYLPWPLAVPQLIDLLNARSAVASPIIAHNIYDDLFDETPSGFVTLDLDSIPFEMRGSDLMDEAEAFFRRDSRKEQSDALRAMHLPEMAAVEATDGDTGAGASRRHLRESLSTKTNARHLAGASFALTDYLTGSLLSGPSRVDVDGIQLVLDPRQQQYHANASLCVLEHFVCRTFAVNQWRLLTTQEFAAVRQLWPPRPYAELQWLAAYLNTQPAVTLANDKRYRLRATLDVQRDYARAARVTRELALGTTLRDAAAAARVTLDEVRRVAMACASAGLLAEA